MLKSVETPIEICTRCKTGNIYYDPTKNDLFCSFCRRREPVKDEYLIRRRKGRPEILSLETKRIIFLFKPLLSIQEIADATGFSWRTIKKIFKEQDENK